jgi:hypothetical protein
MYIIREEPLDFRLGLFLYKKYVGRWRMSYLARNLGTLRSNCKLCSQHRLPE